MVRHCHRNFKAALSRAYKCHRNILVDLSTIVPFEDFRRQFKLSGTSLAPSRRARVELPATGQLVGWGTHKQALLSEFLGKGSARSSTWL